MKNQSHKDRIDESLSIRNGKENKKKQSFSSRRHEEEGSKHADKSSNHKKGPHTALKAKIAKG